MKCICIKNIVFDSALYGEVGAFEGRIYDYTEFTFRGKSGIMVSPKKGMYSTVEKFSEYFIDLIDYRNNKLDLIIND